MSGVSNIKALSNLILNPVYYNKATIKRSGRAQFTDLLAQVRFSSCVMSALIVSLVSLEKKSTN